MNDTNNYLTTQQILARSWQEAKARFAPLFLLALGAPLLGWLLNGLAFGFNPLTQSAARQVRPLLFAAATLVSLLLSLWFLAAFILFVCKRADTPKEALLAALGRLPRLLGAGLLAGAVVAVFLALVLGAGFGLAYLAGAQESFAAGAALVALLLVCTLALVAAAVYLTLWPYLLVLTDEPLLSSLHAAFSLVRGRFWNTLGLLFILSLINMFLGLGVALGGGVFSVLAALAAPQLLGLFSLIWVFAGALTVMLIQIPLIALYIDRSSGGVHCSLVKPSPKAEQL